MYPKRGLVAWTKYCFSLHGAKFKKWEKHFKKKKKKKAHIPCLKLRNLKTSHVFLAFKTCTKCHLEPHNLMVLEVREEILRAQVNNKRCDAERLAIGTVNEKTTYSGRRAEKQKPHVNFWDWLKLKLHLNFSALSAASGIFIVKWALWILWRYWNI